jgi:prepilin-type N-terminal cleavage/methylation domain-containing protein
MKQTSRCASGFTLMEIMIAMVILAMAITVAFQTFSAITRAWTGARARLDTIHHGDFVLDRIASALRSAAFFENSKEQCSFRIKNNSSGEGEHTISWVTSSAAFIPPSAEELAYGVHRIEVGAGMNEDGEEGLQVTAWPYLADEDEVEKKSWLVSENVLGLRCRIYDTTEGEEGWTDTWEYSNAIPGLVEITLYAQSDEEFGQPIELRRLIEIPLGPAVTNKITEAR